MTARLIQDRGVGGLVQRTLLMALLYSTAIALLIACGDSDEPVATTLPAATPELTATPVSAATTTPSATPRPIATPIPATTTLPTATPEPAATPVAGEFNVDLTPDTRWQDVFDAFNESERDCILMELGADLFETVSQRLVISEDETQRWEPLVFGCLSHEVASALFLSSVEGQVGELSDEERECLRGLLSEVDIAKIVAASLSDAGSDDAQTLAAFAVGLLTCLPELMTGGPPPSTQTARNMLWSHPTGGFVVNAPTVVAGVVYVGSDDNHVYALSASTGTELWRFETGDVVRSSPTVVGGVVYIGSNDNRVYALDAETGDELWNHDTGDWVQYSPAASGGVVYIRALAGGDQKLHALDALSGERLWVSENPYPYIDEFALAVVGGKVYMPGEFGEFHALDASTGKTIWSFSAGIGVESSPTVVGGVVYLTAVNTAFALDEETGETIWSYGTERFPARDFPAVVVDGVYYFSPDNVLYALDASTGQPLWSYQTSGFIDSEPLVAEGMVYMGSEDGRFYALDAATGGLVWSHEGTGSSLASPAVVDGVLYAESSDGNLTALNVVTGEELWKIQKGYFDGVPSYRVDGGVVFVGSLDGSIYAFTTP